MEPHPSHSMEAQAVESTPFLRGTGPAVDASSHHTKTDRPRASPPRRGGGVRELLALGLGATCVLAAGVVVVTNGSRRGASLARTASSTSAQSQDTEIAAALSTLQSMDSSGGSNNPALAAMKLGAKGKEGGGEKATSPHIVFVLVDDQGFNDVGFSSNDVYDFTPRIDALMSEGLLLTSYYAQHLCTPARGALMTGKYPIHLGLQHDVIHVDAPWGLPLEHKLLPEYLSEQGYATHMLGKWHLGHFNEQFLPHNRGFDSFFGYLADTQDPVSHAYPTSISGETMFDLMSAEKHGNYSTLNREGEYDCTLFTERATDIIGHHDGAMPLFLYVAHQNTHSPFPDMPDGTFTAEETARLDRIHDSTRNGFGQSLIMLDHAVHNLTVALKDAGFWDNTLFIYSSDNGGCHLAGTYNYPLRGQKYYLFEGGMRVHAFMAGGILPDNMRGANYTALAHISDWLPTVLSVAGVEVETATTDELDGYNLWPSMGDSSEAAPRTELLYNIDPYVEVQSEHGGTELELEEGRLRSAIRVGDWKLVLDEYCLSWFSPVTGQVGDERGRDIEPTCNVTTCADPDANAPRGSYLFNLKNDPYEETNLIDKYPEVADVLETRIREYAEGMTSASWHSTDATAVGTWMRNGNFVVPWVSEQAYSEQTAFSTATPSDGDGDEEKKKRKKGAE